MKRPWMLPFVPLYAAGVLWRNMLAETGWEPKRGLCFPVVSIGNLSTGGAGKTPLTIELARLLSARGFYVDVLSRGYGRRGSIAARVRPQGTAEEFGDEPLLIARETGVPVFVDAERYAAGLLAEGYIPQQDAGRPCVHLLDDGFQHRRLIRTVDVVLLGREDWQDALLPAGNRREFHSALRRAHLLVIPAEEPEFEAELRAWGWQGTVWRMRRGMQVPVVEGPVAAFCGIARPGQFFNGLRAAGLTVAVQTAFRDHFRYSVADCYQLIHSARTAGAKALVTTEKDLARMGSLGGVLRGDLPLHTAHLQVALENEKAALDWLAARLAPASAMQSV
ncbi:MAG TPA: tetraacyldisaccharide 4'-kinase [Terracidiphilus sp.]|nr:tetraacyldisaccharide 4'-kinase [Terracidiphilus sp.]